MELSLINKRALVCGSSEGIGKSIALDFAKNGANIILLARNENKLKETLNSLINQGKQSHTYICADLSDESTYLNKIENVIKTEGHIDILVNNSGGPSPGLISESDVNKFKDAFNQHLIASQQISKSLLPSMKKNKYGRIINILSIGLKQPINNLGVSNTIRGAMASWAKTLSKEVAEYGITVNNILPGYTQTQRLMDLFLKTSNNLGIKLEQHIENMIDTIPAKRFGDPEEIAYLATFLASDKAEYINGASIPVDGGYLSTI